MDNSYILSSQALLPTDSYTHVSEAWGSVSWLDHIVSSADFHHCIQTVSIDYDISDVDHIPVLMGDLFELRRVSNARYKYALRFIKRNEADMRKKSLGNKLADSDSRDFWKEIKGVNNAKMPLPT